MFPCFKTLQQEEDPIRDHLRIPAKELAADPNLSDHKRQCGSLQRADFRQVCEPHIRSLKSPSFFQEEALNPPFSLCRANAAL
jgi:hypothetical protein